MQPLRPPATRASRKKSPGSLLAAGWLGAALAAAAPAHAIDFGPFTLTGFFKAEVVGVNNLCEDNRCQRDPLARKDFPWADELVQGSTFGAGTTYVTLAQPYLSAKFDLPRGFKISGLVSQRWRDGKVDFPGFWYDRSVAVTHEDYGSLRVGAMTTRAWHMADYPFGTDVGLADAWASSGSGYGLLTRAVRYTSRTFDVAEGDVVLEATYDIGQSGWKRNKPRFVEVWGHYGKGDLSVDIMLQHARNGTPSAFSHGPFTGLFYDSAYDTALGGSSQGIAMVMARYKMNDRLEILAGARANRWSGAYAKLLLPKAANPAGYDIWNFPFNVDWSTDLGGGVYKAHAARSVDLIGGARYKTGPWTGSVGLLHLGKADTDNPSERGQSNAATVGTVGLERDLGRGLRVYGLAGMVRYARQGLSPTTMPSNSAFTQVDSRLTRQGNWLGGGVVYTF